MKKVMIVDDELDILYGLQMMLDWEALGFQISALCMDGYDALEMFERSVPDIVITDIRMSGMDGLMLGKYVSEHHPETKVIILSSYSEYSYMQTAIDIKVSAYLLKPVDEDKLIKALRKAADEIDAQTSASMQYQEMESYRMKATGTVLYAAYAKLISGGNLLQDYERDAVLESLRIQKPRLMVARQDSDQQFPVDENREEQNFFFKTLNIAVRNRADLLYSEFRDGQATFILSVENMEDFLQDTRFFCDRKTMTNSYSAIITDVLTTPDELSGIHLAARNQLRHEMLFGSIGTDYRLLPEREPPLSEGSDTGMEHLREELEHAILSMDENRVDNVLNDVLQYWQSRKNLLTEQDVRTQLSRLENQAADILEKKCRIRPDAVEELRFTMMLTHRMDSLESIVKFISERIGEVMEDNGGHVEVADILKPVLQYLHQHYSESLTLERVAKLFHLNPSYLSRVFRKNTGVNYMAYVTNLRIEYAKELLSDTDMVISEISQQCGFNSEPSFYSSFKRFTGFSPGEYRKKSR